MKTKTICSENHFGMNTIPLPDFPTIHCNEHHLKVRLKKRKSRQLCLPNESKNRFVVLNVNFSVVNLVEATLLTSCP
jgi:hypothetical protein